MEAKLLTLLLAGLELWGCLLEVSAVGGGCVATAELSIKVLRPWARVRWCSWRRKVVRRAWPAE